VSAAEPGVQGCSWCRVDHDGQVSWARSYHRRRGRRPVVVPPWSGHGKRERERDERDDRRGRRVSERAGRFAWPAWPFTGPSACERERACVAGPRVLLGRAREKKRESAHTTNFIFLFKKCE
jgi:hypothetical protein